MVIDKESFKAWKSLPISKMFYEALENMLELEKSSCTSASLIMGDNSNKEMARILGRMDILYDILHLEVEEVNGGVEDNEENP